jgi:hypothetical protein
VRIVVAGGRDYGEAVSTAGLKRSSEYVVERAVVFAFLSGFHAGIEPITLLATGGCRSRGLPRGADRFAVEWAQANQVPFVEFPVTDEEWQTLGKRAGPIRNQKMLTESRPSVAIVFPGGRGTADFASRARANGVRVVEVK